MIENEFMIKNQEILDNIIERNIKDAELSKKIKGEFDNFNRTSESLEFIDLSWTMEFITAIAASIFAAFIFEWRTKIGNRKKNAEDNFQTINQDYFSSNEIESLVTFTINAEFKEVIVQKITILYEKNELIKHMSKTRLKTIIEIMVENSQQEISKIYLRKRK